MKTISIQLHDFADVQHYQETFHISYAASFNQILIDIFNWYESEGWDTVVVEINCAILQKSYKNNVIVLAKSIKNRVKYPFIRANKSGQMVALKASMQKFESIFLRKLRNKLDNSRIAQFNLNDIPPAHRQQPAVLTFRLRKQGYKGLKFYYVGEKILFTWNPDKKQKNNEQTAISTISNAITT